MSCPAGAQAGKAEGLRLSMFSLSGIGSLKGIHEVDKSSSG